MASLNDTDSISMTSENGSRDDNNEVVIMSTGNNPLRHGRSTDDGNGQPPRQIRRTVLQPFDTSLSNHILFRNVNFSEVSLSTLKSDDAIQHRLNFKYIDLQILRIITSSQSGANVYSRKRVQTSSNSMRLSRIILCRVYSQLYLEDNNKLVYIMEARNQNPNLWNKNVNHRDSGAISIGSIIRFPSPLPITTYMRNDIPMMTSHVPSVLLKYPQKISSISINEEIEANCSQAFVYNSTQLSVDYFAAVKTSCSGLLCDRQRISDWLGSKGCGCYGMSPNSTSLAIQHAITVRTSFHGTLKMDDFSSLKFSKLYTSGDIPGTCKLYMLQVTEASMNMFNALENCIELINNHGGFTVIGWYKKGLINDKGLIAPNESANVGGSNSSSNYNNNNEERVQVDSGDCNYHVVSISPTNRAFLDNSTDLGKELNALKYKVCEIESSI